MEPRQVFKQMIDFNKTAFNNGFSAMVIMQDNAVSIYSKFIEQLPWFPKEGGRAAQEWINVCKKGRDDVKKLVDENFGKAESFFAETGMSETL